MRPDTWSNLFCSLAGDGPTPSTFLLVNLIWAIPEYTTHHHQGPTIHLPETFLHFLTPTPTRGLPSSASYLHFHYFLYHSTNFRLPLHPKCPNEKLGRHTPTMNILATVIKNTHQRTVQQQSPRENVAGPLGPLKNLYGTVKNHNANTLNPVALTQNPVINPRPRRKPVQNSSGKNRET